MSASKPTAIPASPETFHSDSLVAVIDKINMYFREFDHKAKSEGQLPSLEKVQAMLEVFIEKLRPLAARKELWLIPDCENPLKFKEKQKPAPSTLSKEETLQTQTIDICLAIMLEKMRDYSATGPEFFRVFQERLKAIPFVYEGIVNQLSGRLLYTKHEVTKTHSSGISFKREAPMVIERSACTAPQNTKPRSAHVLIKQEASIKQEAPSKKRKTSHSASLG